MYLPRGSVQNALGGTRVATKFPQLWCIWKEAAAATWVQIHSGPRVWPTCAVGARYHCRYRVPHPFSETQPCKSLSKPVEWTDVSEGCNPTQTNLQILTSNKSQVGFVLRVRKPTVPIPILWIWMTPKPIRTCPKLVGHRLIPTDL